MNHCSQARRTSPAACSNGWTARPRSATLRHARVRAGRRRTRWPCQRAHWARPMSSAVCSGRSALEGSGCEGFVPDSEGAVPGWRSAAGTVDRIADHEVLGRAALISIFREGHRNRRSPEGDSSVAAGNLVCLPPARPRSKHRARRFPSDAAPTELAQDEVLGDLVRSTAPDQCDPSDQVVVSDDHCRVPVTRANRTTRSRSLLHPEGRHQPTRPGPRAAWPPIPPSRRRGHVPGSRSAAGRPHSSAGRDDRPSRAAPTTSSGPRSDHASDPVEHRTTRHVAGSRLRASWRLRTVA